MTLILRSSLRWLRRRPWQTGLAVLGIALAVAVVTGVDLANESARRAFRASVDGVAGRATHEIVGGPQGVDETLYVELRRRGLRPSAPVVEGWVQSSGRTLLLLGIDAFAEGELRSFSNRWSGGSSAAGFGALMSRPGAVVMSSQLATDLGLEIDDAFDIEIAGRTVSLTLIATLQATQDLATQRSQDLLLCDISTAQEALGKSGWLSRIDLRLESPDSAAAQAWRQALPPTVELQSKSSRSNVLDQMTSAFRLNLEALSLLALLVGMFLIYNTMTFAVVERRGLLGTLRVLGVSRRGVFVLVLGEALVLGLVASLLGLLLGFVIARGLLALVSQTINDLYFVLSVGEVTLTPWSLLKGAGLGTLGTLVAAWVPALDAMGTPPRQIMRRSSVEADLRRSLPKRTLLGLAGLLATALLIAIPSTSLLLGFGILLCFVLSCALLVAPLVWLAMRALEPLARRLGLLASLAVRGVAASLSRTGLATAALVVAVAMTLGVTLMVGSFRATLVDWLGTTLAADVYIAPVDFASRGSRQDLDPALLQRLATAPSMASMSTSRRVEVASRNGPTQLWALSMDAEAFRRFSFVDSDAAAVWPRFMSGGAIISEPLAHHRQLRLGDPLSLRGDQGWKDFPVVGIYYDYGSDRGVVSLHRATYDRWWQDRGVHTVSMQASTDSDPQSLIDELRQRAQGHPLMITPNGELRRYSLEVFDRTFVITEVLRLLAIGVAFLGILSALMALQLERRQELAVLRAQGLTPRQLAGQVLTQTSLMGVVAGLLSLPLGIALSLLLIEVINRRAFGWTLTFDLAPQALLSTFLFATAAAVLAGLYPAWTLARSSTAAALRAD